MDDVCVLIKETETTDGLGVPEIVQERRQVFCQVLDITRSEFYAAAAADLNPELTLRLSDFADYEGEKLVGFHGLLYSVIRTYRVTEGSLRAPFGSIELILERKVGTSGGGSE